MKSEFVILNQQLWNEEDKDDLRNSLYSQISQVAEKFSKLFFRSFFLNILRHTIIHHQRIEWTVLEIAELRHVARNCQHVDLVDAL